MNKKNFNQPKISINKVYTKTGDSGMTSIVGGHKFSKSELRIEVFGELEYLNSYIGLCFIELQDKFCDHKYLLNYLIRIQNELFNLGNMLATLPEDYNSKMPSINESDIKYMENVIDDFNLNLPSLQSFVLPGGVRLSVYFHISRAICRKCERLSVKLSINNKIDNLVIQYLNRLSDLMFVLSRWSNCESNTKENIWNPNCK